MTNGDFLFLGVGTILILGSLVPNRLWSESSVLSAPSKTTPRFRIPREHSETVPLSYSGRPTIPRAYDEFSELDSKPDESAKSFRGQIHEWNSNTPMTVAGEPEGFSSFQMYTNQEPYAPSACVATQIANRFSAPDSANGLRADADCALVYAGHCAAGALRAVNGVNGVNRPARENGSVISVTARQFSPDLKSAKSVEFRAELTDLAYQKGVVEGFASTRWPIDDLAVLLGKGDACRGGLAKAPVLELCPVGKLPPGTLRINSHRARYDIKVVPDKQGNDSPGSFYAEPVQPRPGAGLGPTIGDSGAPLVFEYQNEQQKSAKCLAGVFHGQRGGGPNQGALYLAFSLDREWIANRLTGAKKESPVVEKNHSLPEPRSETKIEHAKPEALLSSPSFLAGVVGKCVDCHQDKGRLSSQPMNSKALTKHLLEALEGKLQPAKEPIPVKPETTPPVPGSLRSAINKCVACHLTYPNISAEHKNPNTLTRHLKDIDPDTLKEMIRRAKEEIKNRVKHVQPLTSDEEKALQDFATHSTPETNSPNQTEGGARTASVIPNIRSCYLPDAENRKRTSQIPAMLPGSLMGNRIAEAQRQGGMIFYDRKTVPHTWQSESIGAADKLGAHLVTPKVVVVQNPPFDYPMAGGSTEYPWKHPAGTDVSEGTLSEKFIIPAKDGYIAQGFKRNKKTDPDFFGGNVGVEGPIIDWEFEPGTTFGEVLKIRDPQTGASYPYSVRTRTITENGSVENEFRPFESPKQLAEALDRLCRSASAPTGCRQVQDEQMVSEIYPPKTKQTDRSELLNKNTAKTSTMFGPFQLNSEALKGTVAKALVQTLPALPSDVVRLLLTTTAFRSVMNKAWITASGGEGNSFAPLAKNAFNIFPGKSTLPFIPMNQQNCKNCHTSAGRHVKLFEPNRQTQMNASQPSQQDGGTRSWYNHIQGGGAKRRGQGITTGILSWNPFSPEAAESGASVGPEAFAKCRGQNEGLLRMSEGK